MADKKISALTAASTPLAGTEVLPIVQSGSTVKVAVSDLTAGRAISATQLTLTTGNVIVASGQGIDFSATPGTGTSELLADYEEGTWTVASTGTGTAATTAWYTKIGRQVTCWGAIYQQDTSGPTTFTNLPFTSSGMDANNNAGGYCFVQTGSTAGTLIGVQVTRSATTYQLIKGNSVYAPLNGEVLKFVITYFV